MVTSVIGKIFLEAYNEKYGTSYSAEQFFWEIFYPLFFNSNKYLYWVQNSPFVQLDQLEKSKKRKIETLTQEERKKKLDIFINKVMEKECSDASVAIGYPASDENEFATTSGQVSNLSNKISREDVFCSWFGAALGVGIEGNVKDYKGGLSILFYNRNILLDIYDGWNIYRKLLNSNEKLPGNKIVSWNGNWLSHKYSIGFDENNYMVNFNPFILKEREFSIKTVSWTKILIGITRKYKNTKLLGYVYGLGQMNITIGFIPFDLSQIIAPVNLYVKFFGIESGKKAEKLWGTAQAFSEGCKKGVIGLQAMEPKGLKEYYEGKMPKLSEKDEQIISFNVYQSWIMAMLNNEELWYKAQNFASELYKYSTSGSRAKTVNANKVNRVLESTNKMNFIKSMVDIIEDADNIENMKEIASIINAMPTDNVPYFLTLIRFHYATFNNTK